jgi:hypothetical protein
MSHPSFNSLNTAIQQLKEILSKNEIQGQETLLLIQQMEEHLENMAVKTKANGFVQSSESVIAGTVTPV